MSKSLNANNEVKIDNRNLCTYRLDDYCICEFVPMGTEAGCYTCAVCRYYTPETGERTPKSPVCKWLEDEVCCNGDCPLVGDLPWSACTACKYWETKI